MNIDNYNVPSVSPEVAFIDDLIINIESGKIVLPEFQRPYVWKKEDVIALFDSIYKGYPIGSVLLWDGGGKDIPYLHHIGGRKIDGFSSERFYIVDGQQRLTTLFCCLSDDIIDDDSKWDLYFNLKDESFTHTINKHPGPGYYLSMRSIGKTTTFLKEARRIFDQTGDESLVEKAEYLADRIRKYKMAIIKLGAGTIEEVVQVFSRLNSRGKNIKEQDLVYALTYDKFDGSKINFFIDEVKDCFARYIDIEQRHSEIYLQLIKTAIGFEIYDKDRDKIVERLKFIDEFEPQEWKNIIYALEETLSFVVNTLGINNISKLPYAHQLFMIFHFYYNNKNSHSAKLLTDWFLLVSIYGIGSESPSKREKIINFFRTGMHKNFLDPQLFRILKSNNYPTIPEKYSSNSAVAKTVSLVINFYLSKNISRLDKGFNVSDFALYPPKNIFHSEYTDRVGGKVFHQRNNLIPHSDKIFSLIEEFLPTENLLKDGANDKESIINAREEKIAKIYFNVTKEIINDLSLKYL